MSAESNSGIPSNTAAEKLNEKVFSGKFFTEDEANVVVDELLADDGDSFGIKNLIAKLNLDDKISSLISQELSAEAKEEELKKLKGEMNTDIDLFLEKLLRVNTIEKVGVTAGRLSARYKLASPARQEAVAGQINKDERNPEQEAIERLNSQFAELRRALREGLAIKELGVSVDTSIDSVFAAELLRWFGAEILKNDSLSTAGVAQYADSAPFKNDRGPTGFLLGLKEDGVLPIGIGGGINRNQPLDEHSFVGPRRGDLSAGRLASALLKIAKPVGKLDVDSAKEALKSISGFSEKGAERMIRLIRYCIDDDTRGRDVFGNILDEATTMERHRFYLGRFVGQMWRYCKFDGDDKAYEWASLPIRSYFASAVQGDYDFSDAKPEILKRAVEEWKKRAGDSYRKKEFAIIESYANHSFKVKSALDRSNQSINEIEAKQSSGSLSGEDSARLTELKEKREKLQKNAAVSPFELVSIVSLIANTDGEDAAVEWAQQALNAIYEQGKMRSAALEKVTAKNSKEIKVIDEIDLPIISSYRQIGEFNNEVGWALRSVARSKKIESQIFVEQRKPENEEQGNARVMFFGKFTKSTMRYVASAIGRAELRAAGDKGGLSRYKREDFFKEGSMPEEAKRWYVYFTHGSGGQREGVWLLNGSLKHPTIPATRLTINQIIEAVKLGVRERDAAMEAMARKGKVQRKRGWRKRSS